MIPSHLTDEQRELLRRFEESANGETYASKHGDGPVRPHPPGVSRLIRLAVRCRAQQAEMVLAELLELAPGGFEQVDAPDGRQDVVEYAIYGAEGELPDLGAVEAAAGGEGIVEVDSREVPDDWAERWKRFYFPVLVGGRLYVRPPWERAGASAAASRRS